MSSSPEPDMVDYVYEDTPREEDTLFVPVPDSSPDSWTVFYSGILIGLAGSLLLTVALWLAGLLILAGYGMTAFTLKGPNRFARALRFGFLLSAACGAAILAGEIFYPIEAWRMIAKAGEPGFLFASVFALPWLLGLLRYVLALLRAEKRPAQAV